MQRRGEKSMRAIKMKKENKLHFIVHKKKHRYRAAAAEKRGAKENVWQEARRYPLKAASGDGHIWRQRLSICMYLPTNRPF